MLDDIDENVDDEELKPSLEEDDMTEIDDEYLDPFDPFAPEKEEDSF